jgi:branched-chain amino acid aminotransferase
MEKSDFIWFNGNFVNWDDAKISVMSHTLHYGTGVFEGIRARECSDGTYIFRLSDHVNRLYNSAEAYNMEIPYSKEVITQAIKDSVHKNNLSSAYIRPLVFFGEGEMGLLPKNVPVWVSVSAWNWGAYLGDDAGNAGVKVCISKWKRISPQSFKPYSKGVGGYMNSTLAKVEAVKNGYDDAIMLGDGDVVAEGSGQNVFSIKDGTITTPPVETGALGGITRKTVLEICKELDIKTNEKNLTVADLKNSDELFFTGTATEVVGVVSIDGENIADGLPGKLTNTIRTKYLDIVNGRDNQYSHYLNKVT